MDEKQKEGMKKLKRKKENLKIFEKTIEWILLGIKYCLLFIILAFL
jgi:hypothetical protein